jgi:glycosyltransferase involved in cell wall biosynthesis
MIDYPTSIIIPTRNRPHQLVKCIHALERCIENTDEIIICDNSTDSATLNLFILLKKKFLNVKYCAVPQANPSLARNMGASQAKNDYLAFIDDDCQVDANWKKAVVNIIKRETRQKKLAIHQGLTKFIFPKKTIFSQIFKTREKVIRKLLRLKFDPKKPMQISFINAGHFLLHSSLIKNLHYLFDPKHFPYIGEERDLAIRAQLAHISIFLQPNMRATHTSSGLRFFSYFMKSFLQGRATKKLVKFYVVEKKTAQLFDIKQKDGLVETLDKTIALLPFSFQNPVSLIMAKIIVKTQKLAYFLGKKI